VVPANLFGHPAQDGQGDAIGVLRVDAKPGHPRNRFGVAQGLELFQDIFRLDFLSLSLRFDSADLEADG
jgi:hypothetical protein